MIHQALSSGSVDWLPSLILLHGGQFTGEVHPLNQFVPEIVSSLPCSPALVRHILLIVYFFKELISFIGFLYKCHTGVFNALIFYRKCHKKQLGTKGLTLNYETKK